MLESIISFILKLFGEVLLQTYNPVTIENKEVIEAIGKFEPQSVCVFIFRLIL